MIVHFAQRILRINTDDLSLNEIACSVINTEMSFGYLQTEMRNFPELQSSEDSLFYIII